MTARVWDTATGETTATLPLRTRFVRDLAWSPDGRRLAFAPGYPDRGIRIWELDGAQETLVVPGSAGGDFLAWSPDGRFIVSSPGDRSIGVWDAESGRLVRILEGNTEPVLNVAFSFDGRLLASVASPLYSEHEYYPQWRSYPAEIHSGTVLIWRCDTWEGVAALPIHPFDDRTYGYHLTPPLTFLPGTHHTLVTRGASSMELDIWDLNVGSIVHFAAETPFLQYSNARVVMMGESGVGKTALGLALSGDPFVPTESTHARRVWTLEEQVIQLDAHRREQREILIWDLAGQPGYRLIHQLHLTEVTVAIIVIDGRSETDPFAGVYYWDRALRQAQALQGTAALPVKKLLVAARIDRGGIGVSLDRAKQVAQELGFVDYIETSAKDGRNVRRLRQVILDSIDWDNLPKATSTELFQRIKAYLLGQKEAGRVLSTTDDLYRGFLQTLKATATPEALVEQFETCIGLVEASELILRLSFGNLILLQPELLDAYASALINAVRQEPDGLGSIAEDRVKLCDFPMPADERLADGEQEKLLLLAMIEDLVRRELAFRERTATGPYLVFPSESTRMHPDLPDPEGKMSIFRFDGPLRSIYATLAVRLSYSELFVKKDVWKDAITYSARAGGECGLALRILGEARGELTLFHDKRASKDTRFHFQEFVAAHLLRWALPNTVQRIPVFTGNGCGEPVASTTAERRRELGYDWLACPVCGMRVELDERTEPLSQLSLMDSAADGQRNLHTAAVIVQGKRAAGDFDVFLCHNNQDKAVVREIGEQLLQRGLLPWLDEWELQPGLPWQRSLEDQIEHIRAAAVFVGKSAIGPWQHMELEAFLRQFVQRNCPVIPVILPDCKSVPKLPVFLEGMTWVDLRRVEPDPMARLVWGITGERPPLPFEPQSLREVQA
jgi:small GTP-binding protein